MGFAPARRLGRFARQLLFQLLVRRICSRRPAHALDGLGWRTQWKTLYPPIIAIISHPPSRLPAKLRDSQFLVLFNADMERP